MIVSDPGEQDPDVNRGANHKGAELEIWPFAKASRSASIAANIRRYTVIENHGSFGPYNARYTGDHR